MTDDIPALCSVTDFHRCRRPLALPTCKGEDSEKRSPCYGVYTPLAEYLFRYGLRGVWGRIFRIRIFHISIQALYPSDEGESNLALQARL